MSVEPIVLLKEYSTFANQINLANDPNNKAQIFIYEHIDHPHKLYLKKNLYENIYTCSNRILHEHTDSAEYSCKNVYVCEACNYNLCLECYYKITTKSDLNEDVKNIQILGITSTKNESTKNQSINYKQKFNLPNKISYYGDEYTFNTDQECSKYECMRCSHSYLSFTEKFINGRRNICIYCANDIFSNTLININFSNLPPKINNIEFSKLLPKSKDIQIDHPHELTLTNKGYGQKCSSHNQHKGSTVLPYSKFFYCCEKCNYSLCLNCYKFLYKSDDDFVYTKALSYPNWSDELITFPDIQSVYFKGSECHITLAKNRSTITNTNKKYNYNCDNCNHLYKNNWDSYNDKNKKYDICPYCAKDMNKTKVSFRRKSPKRKSPKSSTLRK